MTTAVDFHNAIAVEWNAKYSQPSFRRRAQLLMGLVDRSTARGTVWLDAGCGAGVLSRELAERGHQVLGVDASSNMIDAAVDLTRELPQDVAARLQFQKVDSIEELSWDDETFDGILCSSVIEYLNRPDDCLSEFMRILKQDGIVVLSVPNKWSLLRLLQKTGDRLAALLRYKPRCTYLHHSKNSYSPKTINQLLRSAGFEPGEISYYEPVFPKWIGRWSCMMLVVTRRADCRFNAEVSRRAA